MTFHEAVRAGYLKLARQEKKIKVIKTQLDTTETQKLIRREVFNVI